MGRVLTGVVALAVLVGGTVLDHALDDESQPRILLDGPELVDITWTQADFCTWVDYTNAVFDGAYALYDSSHRCYVSL